MTIFPKRQLGKKFDMYKTYERIESHNKKEKNDLR